MKQQQNTDYVARRDTKLTDEEWLIQNCVSYYWRTRGDYTNCTRTEQSTWNLIEKQRTKILHGLVKAIRDRAQILAF
jgi:hypothetical protein